MDKARQRLDDVFSRILAGPPGVAVMHSSLPNLLPPARVEEELVAVVRRFITQGWTFSFPAFTFSFCEGKPFHLKKSRSETGVVADLMLERLPAAVRTRHPVYSFVVAGPKAAEIAALPSATCFGDDTPFRYFEDADARQIMLGCGVEYFTQCHRYEELAAVPYRTSRTFSGLVDWADGRGQRAHSVSLLVRDWKLAADTSWSPVAEKLRAAGQLLDVPLWRGRVQAAATSDLRSASLALLEHDGLAFVTNRAAVAEKLGLRGGGRQRQERFGVALLGSANIHLLRRAFEVELAGKVPNRDWQIFAPPFGQLRRELTLADSDLSRFRPDLAVFCDRLEDVAGMTTLDPLREGAVLAAAEEHAAAVAGWLARAGGDCWAVVHSFAPLDAAAFGLESLFASANECLRRRLAGTERVIWLDPAALAAVSGERAVDGRLRYMGRFTLSERMSRLTAERLAGYAAALTGNAARLIVTDLDNTLWGGILGEDGPAGLEIGGDYPGNAYRDFQLALVRLRERGVLLATCSKNDEHAALAAMDSLDGMAIGAADFAAHRIGWRPKWEYVKEIAAELNLGLSSILFIDDNPAERDLLRRALPEVKVLDLPADPAGFAAALLSSPWTAPLPATAEDKTRAGNAAGRATLEKEKSRAVDLEAFYAGLGLKVHLNPLREANAARAEQLCQKTNQFNTTGKRYSRRDLKALAKDGADVVVIGLKDKYSVLENIGVMVLAPDADSAGKSGTVDLFLLSCRVLGRGIEVPLAGWAAARAAARGWTELRGVVTETDRNAPVRAVFADAGWKKIAPGVWSAPPVAGGVYAPPAWLTLLDNVSSPAGGSATKARRTDRRRRVVEVAARVLGLDEDELDAASAVDRTRGWDSMKQIELVLALEQEFDCAVPAGEIMRLRSLADLARAFAGAEAG